MGKRQNKKPKSKMKKTLVIIGIILGVFIVGVGVYAFTIYSSLHNTADKVYKPLKTTKNLPLKEVQSDSPSINIYYLVSMNEREIEAVRTR